MRAGKEYLDITIKVMIRKLLCSMLALLLLFSSLFALIFMQVSDPVRADPLIFYVDDSFTQDEIHYNTIAEAITNALDGYIIYVWDGVYNENIVVDKSLSLIGNGSSTTSIVNIGGLHSNNIQVTEDSVNIQGFTINGTIIDDSIGINVINVNHTNISYNIILNQAQSIAIDHGNDNTIYKNTITLNNKSPGFGINDTGNRTNISHNSITKNRRGIHLEGTQNTTISDCNITDNDKGIITSFCRNVTIENNTIGTESQHGIDIYANSPENYSIQNNILEESNIGIWLNNHCDNNSIIGNTLNGVVFRGIYLNAEGDNNFILNNFINDTGCSPNFQGIIIYNDLATNCTNLTIANNTIICTEHVSDESGIFIYFSRATVNNLNILNNTCSSQGSGSVYGITINLHETAMCSNVTICHNNISGFDVSGGYGLQVAVDEVSASWGAVIYQNNLTGNEYGINLSGENNINQIYHNNFIENHVHAKDTTSVTRWNTTYPDGGNYWDNYTGVDSDSDGLGDTPYIHIAGGGSPDMYPFMEQDGWLHPLDDWPMFQHDAHHTSCSQGTGPITNQTLWNYTWNDHECFPPIVVNKTVFAVFRDAAKYINVLAFNAANGTIIWNSSLNFFNHTYMSPVFVNNTLYVGYGTCMSRINITDGTVIDQFSSTIEQITSSPTVSNNSIYYGRENVLYKHNLSNFNQYTLSAILDGTILYPPAVAGDTLVVGAGKTLYQLNSVTLIDEGSLDITYADPITTTPLIADNVVYIGTQGGVYAFNISDILPKWHSDINVTSSFSLWNDTLYVGNNTGTLFALNASNGHEIKNSSIGYGVIRSTPAIAESVLYSGFDSGGSAFISKICAVQADDITSEIWNYNLPNNMIHYSSSAISQGVLYIGTLRGTLYAFGSNQPPDKPTLLFPANRSQLLNKNAILNWTGGDPDNDEVTYDVYFGTTNPPSLVVHKQSNTTYDPPLEFGTKYYWQIVSWDEHDATNISEVWNFNMMTVAPEEEGIPESGGNDEGDDPPPTLTNIQHTPSTVTKTDDVVINATITDDSNVTSVRLYWDDGAVHSTAMTLTSNNIYTKSIGPFSELTTVLYWIIAEDDASQTTQSTNYSFTVIDTSGPTITVLSPADGTTIYRSNPIIKATYNDPSDIDLHSILLTLDEKDITELSAITTTSITYYSSNLSYGLHTVRLQVADLLHYISWVNWSFIIAPNADIIEIPVGDIIEGHNITILPEQTQQTIIDTIEIRTTKNLSNVTLVIVRLIDKPVEVKNTSSNLTVFRFLDVSLLVDGVPVSNNDIESITISFKIEQGWITEQNIDKTKVCLARYHDDEWQLLFTTLLKEDISFIYYTAVSPGLSTFAVVGSNVVEINPYQSGMPEIPWIVIIGVIVAATIILIVILFKAGYIYREEDTNEGSRKPPRDEPVNKEKP